MCNERYSGLQSWWGAGVGRLNIQELIRVHFDRIPERVAGRLEEAHSVADIEQILHDEICVALEAIEAHRSSPPPEAIA
jgi:hypothetical protein